MEQYINILLIVFFATALGVLFFSFQKNKKKLEIRLQNTQSEKSEISIKLNIINEQFEKQAKEQENLRNENTDLQKEISKHIVICDTLREKLEQQKADMELLQQKFTDTFKALANEILEEKTKKFTEQNRTSMDQLLNPLKEKIKEFEYKVEQTNEKSRLSHTSLIEQIKNLKELNIKISDDANNLTRALKGEVKIQGNWGEVILERILEESGLRKGIEFETQMSLKNETGSQSRPDVVIKLPENKHLIIDSKVSMINYERMISAKSELQQQGYLKALSVSVKKHIDDLQNKHYQTLKGLNSPDFVMLFIPIEGVFTVIMQQDSSIYQYALDKQIVIVSPSTTLATLRTIAFIWRQENQTQNAREIARQSGLLYEKFINFLNDLNDIGKNIKRTDEAYINAVKKLSSGRDNLVRKVERLKELGANTNKQIDSTYLQDEEEIQLSDNTESEENK
jgi:DNA recombination protein RmuC